ncbi:MAG: thiamine phosphate synthase [Kiritimatiellia bacterium]
MSTTPGVPADEARFGLYLILTNPRAGYEACAEAAVQAGVRYLQLRMKETPRDEIVAVARTLRGIAAGTATRFVVNDDPSIASEVGADGVHLGQTDAPIETVRARYPELKIIGLSTHNAAQAACANRAAPAYIGVGPVFATPTKAIPDPVLGCAGAGRIIRASHVPAVAIGGIDAATLPSVLAAGAINFAVVRAVCEATSPLDAIHRLQDIWQEHVATDQQKTVRALTRLTSRTLLTEQCSGVSHRQPCQQGQ